MKKGRPEGKRTNLKSKTLTGELLVTARTSLNMGQRNLANQLGITVSFLSNIERGRCGLPTKYISNIAYLLQLDLNVLQNSLVLDFAHALSKETE